MNLFQLILKQMRQRALSTWLTLLSVLLGVGLATAVLLVYRGGRAYTVGQYSDQLRAAGFKDVTHRTMSVFNAESYIVGKKP